MFDIYSTPVSLEKGENLSTRIRKACNHFSMAGFSDYPYPVQVISTLKEQTPVPFHKPASEEEAIYKQLSFHNPAIRIPTSELQ